MDVNIPATKGKTRSGVEKNTLKLLIKISAPAKKSIGIDNINENFNEFLKLIPNNKATIIVKPDLENPGIIAIP